MRIDELPFRFDRKVQEQSDNDIEHIAVKCFLSQYMESLER